MPGQYSIEFGVFSVSYFALIVVAAIAAGWAVSLYRARRRGKHPIVVLDALVWALVGALFLGRLFYVLNPPPSVARFYSRAWYLRHLFDLQLGPLAVWSGGLGRAGIALGAALGVGFALRRHRCDLREWADILTPGLLIALIFAPWANIVNEQLLGPPTDLPWGATLNRRVPPYTDPALYPPGTRFHPTPAYASLWAAVVLIVWSLVDRRSGLRSGGSFRWAVALYAPGVFLLDFLRVDVSRPLLALTGVQWLALLVMLWLLGGGLRQRIARRETRTTGVPPPGVQR